jgi:uncharacterized protein with NRDE domain
MCLAFFGVNIKPGIKFLLLFNRDEFFNRETLPLGYHYVDDPDYKDKLFYSLDVMTKGTFFCINVANGNFCILLNNNFTTNPYNKGLILKRGAIPIDFCKLDAEESEYISFLTVLDSRKNEYNGFNIVCGNMRTGYLYYYTNNSDGNPVPVALQQGQIFAITNSYLFNSNVRAEYGLSLVNKTIEEVDEPDYLVESLFDVMYDNKRLLEVDLPNYNPSDFNIFNILPEHRRQLVSSVYVNDNFNGFYMKYGTRHTITILLTESDELKIYEYYDDFEKDVNGINEKIKKREKDGLKFYKFN